MIRGLEIFFCGFLSKNDYVKPLIQPGRVKCCKFILMCLLLLITISCNDNNRKGQPGTLADDFRLNTLSHERFYLNQHRGRVVLLVFWTTWCSQCKKELSGLNNLLKDIPGDSLVVAAVCSDPENMNELKSIVSVSVKALPWGFFIQSLKFAVGSLVNNMNLVKKIYFPKVVFPLSYILSQLFDFIVATAAFTVMFMIAHIGVSIHILWLPLMILLLVMLTAGLGMILSCANLYFRDVRYIVDVILTFGIFFTPVFYESSMFSFGNILLLNPVGAILENINNIVVLHQPPDFIWLGYAAVWSFLAFFWGWSFFHKKEPTFAEFI